MHYLEDVSRRSGEELSFEAQNSRALDFELRGELEELKRPEDLRSSQEHQAELSDRLFLWEASQELDHAKQEPLFHPPDPPFEFMIDSM